MAAYDTFYATSHYRDILSKHQVSTIRPRTVKTVVKCIFELSVVAIQRNVATVAANQKPDRRHEIFYCVVYRHIESLNVLVLFHKLCRANIFLIIASIMLTRGSIKAIFSMNLQFNFQIITFSWAP